MEMALIMMMILMVMVMVVVFFSSNNIVKSFSLFQPIDVSHIYRADLDETPQKRLSKKKNTMMADGMRRNEVRTKIALPIYILYSKLTNQRSKIRTINGHGCPTVHIRIRSELIQLIFFATHL